MKFLLLVLVFAVLGEDVSSDCPSPLVLWNDIANCQASGLSNDPRILKHLGGLFDMNCTGERVVVKCIRALKKSCVGDENKVTRYQLRKLIDAKTLDRATDYFCENIELLSDNKDCLNNASIPGAIDRCMLPVREKYNDEFDDAATFFSPNSTDEVNAMMPALCRYSYGAMKCHEVVKGMCDADAVAAYLNLVYANVLNACRVA